MTGVIKKLLFAAVVCTAGALIISGAEERRRDPGVLYVYDGMKIDGDYLVKLVNSYAGKEILIKIITGEGERITVERGEKIETISEGHIADRKSKSYINPTALYSVRINRDELGELTEMNFFAVVKQ